MGIPKPAKRSACDRCRAKRVRCPRGQDSTGPCARCVCIGAQCLTGSPGYPGRPRKAPLDNTAGPTIAAADVSTPGYWSTPRDSDDLALDTPAMDETMSISTPSGWLVTDTSLNLLDDLEATGLSNFVDFPLTEDTPPSSSIPILQRQLSAVSHHQNLPSGADSLDFMYARQDSDDMLNLDFLESSESPSNLGPVQPLGATTLLMEFGGEMERRRSAMVAFLSHPRNLVEDCAEDSMGMATDNPVAVILACTKRFTEIIQNITASTRPAPSLSPSQVISPTASSVAQPDSLNTETTLLILSSFLQLIKLYHSLFHVVFQNLSQISAQTLKSLKVKAVLRIGGLSSLQDLPAKAYAVAIVELIRSHVQTLERSMALPAAYCLSSEAAASPTGIFAHPDRARLLHLVMAQEDVRSPRGDKSYVESIRDNIKNSLALFGD